RRTRVEPAHAHPTGRVRSSRLGARTLAGTEPTGRRAFPGRFRAVPHLSGGHDAPRRGPEAVRADPHELPPDGHSVFVPGRFPAARTIEPPADGASHDHHAGRGSAG